jgi:hypothetical protein
VREKTWKSVKELLTSIKEKLEKIPKDYQILQGLWELLDNKQKSLVKPHLLTETIWMLELKIDFMNK